MVQAVPEDLPVQDHLVNLGHHLCQNCLLDHFGPADLAVQQNQLDQQVLPDQDLLCYLVIQLDQHYQMFLCHHLDLYFLLVQMILYLLVDQEGLGLQCFLMDLGLLLAQAAL